MMIEMRVENMFTVSLSNHKSDQSATRKDDKTTTIKQQLQLQEKTSSDRLNLTPTEFIFLKRKFQTNDVSSRGGKRRRRRKDEVDVEVEAEGATNINYTTKKSITAHEMTTSNEKYDSSMLSTLTQQNPHPFNIVCLAARSMLANCCFTNSYCSSRVSPRRRRRQSSACSMTYLLVLATLATLHTIPLIAAGQQQKQQQQVSNDFNPSGQTISSNSYHEAENSETISWPTKAAAAAATTSGFHKHKLNEQEISKSSEQQNKNKNENENETENESQNQEPHQQQQQRTSYHDSDLDPDLPFHSQSVNLSKQQQQIENKLNERDPSIKGKRSKRSTLNKNHGKDMELDMDREIELELETHRKPDLSSMSRESKRNNIWRQNRYRRQLVQDGSSTIAVTEQTFGTVLNGNQAGECNRLLKFWASFKLSYPSLAAHLLTVHVDEDAPQQANQYSFKTAQLIKSIARLLNEAELLARFSTTSSSSNNRLNPWLSRVLTNPMYAKIVQHFPGANQQMVAKLQQQQQHLMRVSNNNNNHMAETNEQQQQQQQQQQWNNSDGHVYGRVIHYPHELTSNAGSPMRTLQKLRELSNQRHLFDSSLGGVVESQSPDRELESNRIQTVSSNGGDGETWTGGDDSQKLKDFSAKNYDSDLDSARNKFVYGSVLLKPNQNNEAQGNELPLQRHQNSIGTLRQLQRGSLGHQQTSDDLLAIDNARGSHHQVEPAIESYGRILVSPASLSSRQQQEENQEHNDGDNQQQQQHHHHDHHYRFDGTKQNSNQQQRQQGYDRWSNKSTLDKLKQKLDASTNQFGSPSSDLISGNGNSGGELSEQQTQHQHVNSMVPHSSLDSGTNPDPNNEFEGDWHSGPLQQVEIRQTNNNGAATGHITHTTSNPRDAFIIE